MEDTSTSCKKPTWQNCVHCPRLLFTSATEFERLYTYYWYLSLNKKHYKSDASLIRSVAGIFKRNTVLKKDPSYSVNMGKMECVPLCSLVICGKQALSIM